MADGFIVRRGGKATEQALAPTITEVSKTDTQIVFTIKNNDTSSAVILWEIGDTTPDANSLELAADTTSSNITVTGLDDDETYIVYATANVTGKIKSEVASKSITTDPAPSFLSFDGTDDYVEVNQDSSFASLSAFTIEAWGRLTVTNDNESRTIFNIGSRTSNRDNIEVVHFRSGLDRGFGVRLDTNGSNQEEIWQGATQSANVWYHVAVTYDGSTVRLYVDGNQEATGSLSGYTYSNSTDGITIGQRDSFGFFPGDIDEVRLWNVARTAQQIDDNYQTSLTGNESGLVSYWKFDEGSGTTAIDSAGSNDGTIIGATYTAGSPF